MPLKEAAANPATTATTSNTTSSTNTLTRHAPSRGSTRYWRGSIPIASSARTSPITRLVASSDAIAVPERPAMASAVISGPSSRTITTTISVPIRSVAPMRPSSRTACEMTRNGRIPDSSTMRPTARPAVKRNWLRVTRSATGRHRAQQIEQLIALHLVRLDLDDLSGLDVDEPGVDAEVTVEIDELSGDDVPRPDQLADTGGGLRFHAPRRAEVLLFDQPLD